MIQLATALWLPAISHALALTLWFQDRSIMEHNGGLVGARRRSWRWRESCWCALSGNM